MKHPTEKSVSEKITTVKVLIGRKKNWKYIILGVILLILFIAGRVVDLHTYMEMIRSWIWRLGPWGPVAYGAIYIGAMLLLFPGSPFTIFAALLFGTFWGFITMLTASTLAAMAGFLIARYLAREWVEQRVGSMDSFDKIKIWVEKNHWLAIPFIRIMPFFPFSLNNYILGLTRVSFPTYMLASEIIFIPMTAVLVLGAQALYTTMIRGEIAWGIIAGTAGAGLLLLIIGLAGKKNFSAL